VSALQPARVAIDLTSPAARRRLALGTLGAALLGWTAYATVGMVDIASEQAVASQELAQREFEVAALRGKVALMQRDGQRLRTTVETTVARLEARQQHLSILLGGDLGRMVLASANVPAANLPATDRAVLAPLARLESQQLALIDQATSATHARYQGATALIRQLGLDPDRFARMSRPALAMGGPEEAEPDSSVQDLYKAWNSLTELGDAVGSLPSRMPVQSFSYTSGFGVRYDPFSGRAAMHAGLDMAGAHGEPILSTAEGIVVRAGWVNGYGNFIEIDHGRGISTRYGHLSRVQVRPGDRVVAGDQIGKMGSTGRSTGTHLHYEVRVDGQAVDPMPYLRAAPTIAALQAPVIMMSQNRQSDIDRHRAENDYNINIKAEHEIKELQRRLAEIEIKELHRKIDEVLKRLDEK